MRFSYVLPVHNQQRVLERTVRCLRDRLQGLPGSEVLLVENGSSDASPELCKQLAGALDGAEVRVRPANSQTGLGHALRRGMQMATGDVVVLTAADLPFGFTDLEAFLALPRPPQIAIGSKAHPGSRVDAAWRRRAMSRVFRELRVALLDLRVGDSQGTIFIDSHLCRRVLPHLACADFLISTEIVCWAARLGADAMELPIVYPRSHGSTVSPLRDSARMVAGLFALRRRLRAVPVAATAARQL